MREILAELVATVVIDSCGWSASEKAKFQTPRDAVEYIKREHGELAMVALAEVLVAQWYTDIIFISHDDDGEVH